LKTYKELSSQKRIQRFFEILPGLLIWILLLSPIWGSLSVPILIINTLVVLSVYWVYRSIMLTLGVLIGFYLYKRAIKQNWLEKIYSLDFANLPNPESLPKQTKLPKHLIVIPNYGEDYTVISRTLKGIVNQNYPKELVYVAISQEERKALKDREYAQRAMKIKQDFGSFFEDRIFCFMHPANLPDDEPGAASNRTWGAKNAVKILEKRGENIEDFIVTAPDGDLFFHKEYLAACSYKWLTVPDRNNKFYQTALYTFNNNYWEVPILVRILVMSITLPVLASSIFEKHKRETWSCFSLNLKLLKDVDYWDTTIPVGADDTTFYWRPYFHLNGNWDCEVFFIPLSADAVYHSNYFRNHIDQYKQYLRWGWGVISFPLALRHLIAHKNIPLFKKAIKIYRLFEVFVFWKVLAFLIAFGIPIVFLFNKELSVQVISITVPETISALLTLSAILLLPNTIIKALIAPPRPAGMKKLKYLLILLVEMPLNVVSLFSFGFFPFIDASTRMMLGTEKRKVTWAEKFSDKMNKNNEK